MEGVGAGIGASLRGVDCAASEMAQAAFNRLFSAEGSFGPALTILLTLWIAFLGFGLITGRTRLGLSSLTPREERVLRMRFGIGMNTDHTLEEVGQQFSVTRERIRQIEAKALRKLKHPSRSRKLRSFLDQ